MFESTGLSAPGVLPVKVRVWALALAASANVSFEFALLTLLSAMSAAVSGIKHVRRPDGGVEGLSLIVFGLAPPAYGKTRVFTRAYAAHMAEDADRLMRYLAACEEAEDAGGSKGGQDRHAPRPRLRSVLLQDVSRYGLVEELQGLGESVALATHEGNIVLRSNLFQDDGLEMATSLWDGGGSLRIRRGRGRLLVAMGASMPMLVLVQRDIFETYRKNHGRHAKGIGFFDRTLFVNAALGGGGYQIMPPVDIDCLADFDALVRGFLRRANMRESEASQIKGALLSGSSDGVHFDDASEATDGTKERDGTASSKLGEQVGSVMRDELTLTYEAANVYSDIAHSSCNRGFWLSDLQGAIGRSMQQVLRIAGLLQTFDNEDLPVSVQAVVGANAIVDFCLHQAADLFPSDFCQYKAPVVKPSTFEKQQQRLVEDAQSILRITRQLMQLRGEHAVAISDVRERFGFYAARFSAALAWLKDTGQVTVEGKRKREKIVIMPQSVFGNVLPLLQAGPSW